MGDTEEKCLGFTTTVNMRLDHVVKDVQSPMSQVLKPQKVFCNY